jgi:hypothetical protein
MPQEREAVLRGASNGERGILRRRRGILIAGQDLVVQQSRELIGLAVLPNGGSVADSTEIEATRAEVMIGASRHLLLSAHDAEMIGVPNVEVALAERELVEIGSNDAMGPRALADESNRVNVAVTRFEVRRT